MRTGKLGWAVRRLEPTAPFTVGRLAQSDMSHLGRMSGEELLRELDERRRTGSPDQIARIELIIQRKLDMARPKS
jgi:hypothetical protein